MKFSCTQENLIHALGIASRTASRAGNLPILSNVHIKAEQEGIVIRATNLEIGVTCKLRGKVEEEGEFTVPAKLFTDYIAFLPKERVDVVLQEQAISISCGSHHTKIKGTPAVDFPLIPSVEEGQVWNVSLPALLEGLEQVLFTVSPGETRPEISGALLRCEGNRCVLAGTDSYRLAEKTMLSEGAGSATQVIVPLRALQELARICAQAKEEAGTAKIALSQNQLALVLPSVELVSRLIEGQYPDYRAIVPSKFGTEVKLPRSEFAGAIKAAGLFSRTGVYDVGIEIKPKDGTVTVAALNSQTGEHESALVAEVRGNETKIAFNWKYLLEGVQAFRGTHVVLKATDSASPTMLTDEGTSDYFYIVMPIKE